MSDHSIERPSSFLDRIVLLLRGPFDGAPRPDRGRSVVGDEDDQAERRRDDDCPFSEALAFWPHM